MPDTTTARDAILAKAAGLERAWADHQADVVEAIEAAARLRTAFHRPTAPTVEPTPPHAAPPHAPPPPAPLAEAAP